MARELARRIHTLHGVRSRTKSEIEALIDELNRRLGLKEDYLTIESYRPGRVRYYRIVVKNKEDGRVVPWSPWFESAKELENALRLAVNVARYMQSHR